MTEFEEIYDLFLSQITDYNLVKLEDDELDEELAKLLQKAIFDFRKAKNLKADFDDETFNRELSNLEKSIIINFMVYEWIKPQVFNIEVLRQRLSQTDFKIYSQANHLMELRALKEEVELDCEYLCKQYDLQGFLGE